MATGTVVYITSNRLECGCRKNSPVILCVSPSLVPPHQCSIDATLLSESVGADCGTQLFTYLFKYDTEDLSDPATPLDSKSIFGVVCRSCLTKWVECQLPCFNDSETVTWSTDEDGCFVATAAVASSPCVVDTSSIDFSVTGGNCITGSVKISADASNIISIHSDGLYATGGGGGNFWSLTGNAGTVDGTNFLGTTDNVPLNFKINNQDVYRFQAPVDYVNGAPSIVANSAFNVIEQDTHNSFDGNGILSGGGDGNENKILRGADSLDCSQNVIGGGYAHLVQGGFASGIFSGQVNSIFDSTAAFLGGGENNIIENTGQPRFVGGAVLCGGNENQIVDADTSSIVGGDSNLVGGTSSNVNYLSLQSIIGGGTLNVITNGVACGIFSGEENEISGDATSDNYPSDHCVIAGGFDNIITKSSTDCSILGGSQNAITLEIYSSIVGGQQNSINTAGSYNFIGGGAVNVISATDLSDEHFDNSIVGGNSNTIDNADYCVIGGGADNSIAVTESPVQYSFIGAGNLLIVNSSYAAIVSGFTNSILSALHSDSDVSVIVGGQHNVITASELSSIVGGASNSIENGFENSVIGGHHNQITQTAGLDGFANAIVTGESNLLSVHTQYCTILGGESNTVTSLGGSPFSLDCTILSGQSNVIQDCQRSSVTSGASNTLTDSSIDSAIVCGNTNSIVSSVKSSIVGGQENSITNSKASFIGNGNDTDDFAQGNLIDGGVCDAIVCGAGNTITADDSNFLVASFIGAGDFNTVTSSLASAVVAGERNSVVSSDVINLPTTSRSIIGAGTLNVITNEEDGFIGAGQSNAITGTSFSDANFIGAGRQNVISDGFESGIVTGGLNTVGHTNFGTILGGQKNSIPTGSHYASVLGGALLKLGVHSFGYQNPLSLNVNTDPYRDVSAFSGIGFCGDADFWVGNTDGTARKLKLFGPNSAVDYSTANYSSFESQAQSAKIEYVMPVAAGTPGQQLTIDTVVGTVVTLKWA